MSSYIDHYRLPAKGELGWQLAYSWTEATAARLCWLYGEGRANTWQAKADLAAWNALGEPKGRAA